MPDWITYLLVFALGAGVGAFIAMRVSGGGGRFSAADREKKKALNRLYKESPAFFDCLRADLKKPEGQMVREFAILESGRVTFVSDVLRFVYYEDDLPDVKKLAEKLESDGFVEDVTPGKIPIYRMRGSFIESLKAL